MQRRKGRFLANIQSAKKRARQAAKRRAQNMTMRSRLRTAIRRVLLAVRSGDKAAAQASYTAAVPEIDRMVGKGIIRKNRAAHYKSRLNARVRALS
jgi:small subunit ribosomal protein S20